jgi:hypothetical protein
MPRELTEYNTSLFAKKVLPQIKGLFEDKWEHKWWPKPVAQTRRQQPAPVAAFAS